MLEDVHMYGWELVPGLAFRRVRHQFLTLGMQHRVRQTVQVFARLVQDIIPIIISSPLTIKLDSLLQRGSIIQQLGNLLAYLESILTRWMEFPKAYLNAFLGS